MTRLSTAIRRETWVSVATAARILNVSARQVRRLVESGILRGRRLTGRGWIQISYESVCQVKSDHGY